MTFFTAADGTRLHFEDEGAGLPVLCLAGLTRTTRDFDFVAPHLDGVRLIRMDYRGRGQSDWPGPEGYTLMQEGADAQALLDHLGIDKAAILGTSRGGLIAMGLGAVARDRLLGVCLNDIGPDIAAEGIGAILDYLGLPPVATTFEEAAQLRGAYMQVAGFENVAPEVWQREVRFAFDEVAGGGLALKYDARLREAVETMAEQEMPDLWPLFATLKGLPLAVVHGVNSNILYPDTVARMHTENPDIRVAEVPGRGHVPFLDEPEALEVIHAWLKDMT